MRKGKIEKGHGDGPRHVKMKLRDKDGYCWVPRKEVPNLAVRCLAEAN